MTSEHEAYGYKSTFRAKLLTTAIRSILVVMLAIDTFCPRALYLGRCDIGDCPLRHDAKYCELCHVICSPLSAYDSHLMDKQHVDRAARGIPRSTAFYCSVCNIDLVQKNTWHSHISGARHRKAATKTSVSPDVPPTTADRLPGNMTYCKLCQINVITSSWRPHLQTRVHKAQESHAAYKNAFEKAERDKEGVTVNRAEGGIDFGVVELADSTRGVRQELTVSATTSSRISIVETKVSSSSSQTVCPFCATVDGSNQLKYGRDTKLVIIFRHNQRGRFEGHLQIIFHNESNRYFTIVRRLRAIIGDTVDHQLLKASTPYVQHKRVPWRRGQRYYPGRRPPALDAVRWIKKLRTYVISSALATVLSKGKTSEIVQQIQTKFLPKSLDPSTHGLHFKCLLWIEEHRMESDLRIYDMAGVKFTKEGNLHYLVVPGLAEKRPSVVVGDRIEVQSSGANTGRCFEGWVHVVRRDDVGLDFHSSFKPTGGQRFNIRFKLNRIPLRRQHQALGAFPRSSKRFLFPESSHAGLTKTPTAVDLPIVAINPLVAKNTAQLRAVRSILRLHTEAAPFIIFGPPGTGKTVTVVEAIRQLLSRDPRARIFACAPSNSAADILAERLETLGPGQLFRFYAVSRDKKHVPDALLRFTHVNSQGYFSVPPVSKLSRFRVVVSTCGSASFAFGVGLPPGHFSHIFIDEAGQATEAEVMTAIKTMTTPSTQIVLSGDPKQLGPIIRSSVARELGLGVSYLERLMSRELYDLKKGRNISFVKLVNNFRSHAAILNFPNEQFYGSELRVCGSPATINALIGSTQLVSPDFPVIFHAISGKDEREASSPSYFNIDEISVGKDYVQKLKADSKHVVNDEEIGIIAPYNAQVRKFRMALSNIAKNVKVASVEEFQGQEKKVIILSTVRSSHELLEYDAKYTLGFVANPRRFNVAITRAQALLIVIGNPSVLSIDSLWRRFLNYVYLNGGWRGNPITWDPRAPVIDDDSYVQEMRKRALSDIAGFVQQVGSYDADLTARDVEESNANANTVWREQE